MSDYEQLHRQCRTLENLFDTKLTSYSQLSASISRNQDVEANGSSERWRDLETELDDLLEKAGAIATYSTREVFQDNARELRRTKTSVKSALDQANLLSGVRNDIDAYKSSTADALLAERGRIDSSHRMTDEVLEYGSPMFPPFRSTHQFIFKDKPMKHAQSLLGSARH
ncbi:hypothetical protein C0991_007592 [Blastosporella zonata]|nr:hypothetical protein C0991_007592 [Blastosporella zonata]